MDRPTIKDIARVAGVSPGAVSFALNDKPGVSEQTRRRVRQVAQEMGWTRSVAALALAGNRAGAVGLVIARSNATFAGEGFFLHLIAGMEEVLTARGLGLVLQLVGSTEEEVEVERRWWAERRVDGVVLVDPEIDDPRWALFGEVDMPAAVVGVTPTTPLPGVRIDDAAAAEVIVDHLAGLGHRRIAWVGGSADLWHTRSRVEAFVQACRLRDVDPLEVPATDFSESAGLRETARLLAMPQRPSAIVYDNEVLAVGGVRAIHESGRNVPGDVAVVSFEDSPVCRVMAPPLTALHRDPSVLGRDVVKVLLGHIDEGTSQVVVEDPPELVVRGSTGAPLR